MAANVKHLRQILEDEAIPSCGATRQSRLAWAAGADGFGDLSDVMPTLIVVP